MKIKTPSKKVILFFIILTLGLGLGFHFLAPLIIIKPFRKTSPYTPKDYKLNGTRMEVRTGDGLLLSAYHVRSKRRSTKATILLLHGIGGCKEHLLGLSQFLADKGYASVAIDGRAHGKSEGEYCTYGYFEKEDLSKIIADVRKIDPNTKIGIWGTSLGGAIALQAMAHDEQIEFGIVQSTFTNLATVVSDYQKRYFGGLSLKFAAKYALWRAGRIAGFSPVEVSPIAACSQIEQPVLILHGTNDKRISISHGTQLYDELASEHKFFVPIEGGNHGSLSSANESVYFNAIHQFLDDFGQ